MDYEKKYKEALEWIRDLYPTMEGAFKEDAEHYFPELKESEDERIRKMIIYQMERWHEAASENNVMQDIKDSADAIAWLKKQGEQNPNTNYLLSWNETDEKMLQSLEGIVKDYWARAEQDKNEIKIREASDVYYFLKTIQKSPLCWIKCSDRLPNKDGIYLVVTDGRHNDVYDIARYDSIEGWHKASEIIYWMPIPQLNNKSILKQNHTWSEEDLWMIDALCSIFEINYFKDYYKTVPKGNITKEAIGSYEIIRWLKSLKDKFK